MGWISTYKKKVPNIFVFRSAKAFYARSIDDETVSALDLLLPEVGELCGGSLREHRPHVLEERWESLVLHRTGFFGCHEWMILLCTMTAKYGLICDVAIEINVTVGSGAGP